MASVEQRSFVCYSLGMGNNDQLIETFRQKVVEASRNPNFIHHTWFVEYHLAIMEKIALELLKYYPQADRDIVCILVWLHDYGKILDFANQYQTTLSEGPKLLKEVGFDDQYVQKLIQYVDIIDKKLEVELREAPIEVQIVSSADGCSHLVGPFMYLWWWENSGKDFRELMADNKRKAAKDWERKIVLPEARAAFEGRHNMLLEQSGEIPERFFSNI